MQRSRLVEQQKLLMVVTRNRGNRVADTHRLLVVFPQWPIEVFNYMERRSSLLLCGLSGAICTYYLRLGLVRALTEWYSQRAGSDDNRPAASGAQWKRQHWRRTDAKMHLAAGHWKGSFARPNSITAISDVSYGPGRSSVSRCNLLASNTKVTHVATSSCERPHTFGAVL